MVSMSVAASPVPLRMCASPKTYIMSVTSATYDTSLRLRLAGGARLATTHPQK
jgi:hypothetical protein